MTDIRKHQNPPLPDRSPQGEDLYIIEERPGLPAIQAPEAPPDDETLIRKHQDPALNVPDLSAGRDEYVTTPARNVQLSVPELQGQDEHILTPMQRPALTVPELQGQDLEIVTERRIPVLQADIPPVEDDNVLRKQFFFDGEMDISTDPVRIKEGDYSDVQNLRYCDGGLQGVNGTTNISTTPPSTYLKGRSAIQLRTPFATTSYILAQHENAGETASRVLEQTTEPAGAGDFSNTAVLADDASAGLGRFSKFPGNQVGYCNGVDSCIWAGDEKMCDAFLTTTAELTTSDVSDCMDVTDAMRNTLATTGNTVTLAAAAQAVWLVGSTRPLQGVKYYLSSVNGSAASLTAKEWNGTAWNPLTITDGTSGLDTSETSVTWATTEDSSKPLLLGDRMLYWYMFTLSAGSATVQYVTVDAAFQQVKDIWDGVPRVPIQFHFYDDSESKDNDLSQNVIEPTPAGYDIWQALAYNSEGGPTDNSRNPYAANIYGMTTSDYLIVGFEERVTALNVTMYNTSKKTTNPDTGTSYQVLTTNDAAAVITVKYWDGDSWVAVDGLVDGTSNGTDAFNASGQIMWSSPSNHAEKKKTEYGSALYYYRIELASGGPLDESASTWNMVLVDVIKGVTAPNEDINAYTFPFYFANRAMLCGKVDTNELNRIDYSATNAPDVWNGEDSSFGPTGPLYFGEGGELTCAASLYNRLGSNLYDLAVICKRNETYMLTGFDHETWKIYTVSSSIGCPAPLTMSTADIGMATGDEATRNIAIWLSYNGPVIFDGNSIIPIGQKIKPYFDKTDSRCVLHSLIEKSIGWVDNDYDEYNLLIPSGSSATSVNVWLCYDIKRNRWFRKQPNSLMGFGYPQAVVKVQDAYGTQYVYGFFDNGYMKRLEYGTTWAGSVLTYAIQQSIQTAAQVPTGDIWDQTKIRRIKVVTDAADAETSIVVGHYADGSSSATNFAAYSNESTDEYDKETKATTAAGTSWNAWSHKFGFTVNTADQSNGIKFLMWGYQYVVTREDI